MMAERAPLADLPFWPLFLGQDEAARYVGVSTEVFVAEVAQGLWPAPRRRGNKGGRLTWHRPSLDATAARHAGTDQPEAEPGALSPGVWGDRSDGPTTQNGTQRRSEKTA